MYVYHVLLRLNIKSIKFDIKIYRVFYENTTQAIAEIFVTTKLTKQYHGYKAEGRSQD